MSDATPFDVPHHQLMPASIAKAVIAVKKQVKQLGADDKNDHGNYRYVSVDKFYERIGPMMAEAGLALLIDETETDVRVTEATDRRTGQLRKTPWLFVQYSLAFMHEGGETSAPMRRSLAMPITGPQSYGAAQSYIEKQFLRQIFKIPTGEKDADETEEDDQNAPSKARPQPRANGNGTSGHSLPPHPEEPPAIAEGRNRIQALIDRLDRRITAAPDLHRLDVVMEDAERADLKEIEEAGRSVDAANLRAKANAKATALRSKAA